MKKKIIVSSAVAGIFLIAIILAAVCIGSRHSDAGQDETVPQTLQDDTVKILTEKVRKAADNSMLMMKIISGGIEGAENMADARETLAEDRTESMMAEAVSDTEEAGSNLPENPDTEPEEPVQNNPVPSDAPDLEFGVASLNTAKYTNQIVMAVGDGSLSGAVVYLFEMGDDLVWRMTLKSEAHWGRKGISYSTKEGDNTTPAGSYDLGLAFGNYPNPGTALPWVDVNEYMYWVDDLNSDYYNLLIDSREVPDGWQSGEHLSEIMPDYAYAVNIEVNPQRTKDSTSAIFLHCGQNPTGGCVAVPENVMVTLLQRLRPGAKMIIAENYSTINMY